jgi:lysyl-tRNA synthetase, class II
MSDPITDPNENHLIAERRAKLERLRERGNAFPNDFRRDSTAEELHVGYDGHPPEWFDAHPTLVTIAGRMMFKRVMGKASFAKLKDRTGLMQVFLQQEALGATYEEFKGWDVGDILGAEGTLFKTKTGELSVRVERLRLLVKSLRPLPDKWHGLADVEQRYRQRYVDLIVNDDSRQVFRVRNRIVQYLRHFLEALDFMEVETPMMQVIPGGAVARPFVTHHNALDVDMYLRIAPELYLKRLVVGGFERVYELNRNFRNEGLSTQHNPEFTMLELYQAYADYGDLMDMVERIFQGLADTICGTRTVEYQGETFDFTSSFRRITIEEMILKYNPGFDQSRIRDVDYLREVCGRLGVKVEAADGAGKLQTAIFDSTGEHELRQPTFVCAYPAEVCHRPLRVLHRWPGAGQRFLRAERCGRPGGAVQGAGRTQDVGRRGGDVLRRRLRPGAGVRPAAYGRPRHRRGSHGDALHQPAVDPRRAAVPAHAARVRRLPLVTA